MHPLVQQHVEIERRIREVSAAQIGNAWTNLGSWRDADIPRFLDTAVPTTLAAQRQSVLATSAFVSRFVGKPVRAVPVEQIMRGIRNGATPEDVYVRPFKTLWTRLGAGEDFNAAMAAALQHALNSARMDPQLAMRDTADHLSKADLGFYGYTRQADSDACEFCQAVDGAYVKASEGFVMALHNNCGCGLQPNLTEPPDGAVFLPDGTQIREYQYGPLNENVAVRDHSELGPILGDPAHAFTSLN